MGPLYAPTTHMNSLYDNFAWFGPFDPGVGWGFHLEGNVPLYDADGGVIGRCVHVVLLVGQFYHLDWVVPTSHHTATSAHEVTPHRQHATLY